MAKCCACNAKKGKRTCPGLDGPICSFCCGTKRGKEIDCPADCTYLAASRQYRGQRDEERRLAEFERELHSIIGNETAYQGVLHNIEFMIYRHYRNRGDFADAEVAEAFTLILEAGKERMGLPSQVPSEPSATVRTIADVVEDVLDFKASVTGRDAKGMDTLKCVFRVLDSVLTHQESDNPCSYLDFIGNYVGG